MRIGAVKVFTTTSNSTITLSYSNPLVLYNIKILAMNSKMDLTITITNSGGDTWSFTVTSGTEVTFKKINYQSITFEDTNTYTIYYTLQAIYTSSYQELLAIEQENDISIVPIDNVIITSPVDSQGNLMVAIEEQPIKANVSSPLDSSGNVNINLQSVTQSSLDAHAFSNTLTTANTKQALAPPSGYPSTAQSFIIVINLSPSDTIYVGDSNNQIIPLSPNQSVAIDIHKSQFNFTITSIYWYGATATTDKVGVMYA
jgi:hypothetical protein